MNSPTSTTFSVSSMFMDLPWPVLECEREALLSYQREAVLKEQAVSARHREKLQQLKEYVNKQLLNAKEKKAYPIGRLSRSPCNTAGHLSPPPPHTPMGRLSPSYHVHVEGRPASLATATHPYSYSYQQTLHMCAHLTTSQGTGAGRRRVKKNPGEVLAALARGFLTRRLLASEKVQLLTKTAKDASSVLNSLGTPATEQDRALWHRVSTQRYIAKLSIHDIFFEASVGERMGYIAHSRLVRQEREQRLRPVEDGVGRSSASGRLSSATLKVMERKQNRQLETRRRPNSSSKAAAAAASYNRPKKTRTPAPSSSSTKTKHRTRKA